MFANYIPHLGKSTDLLSQSTEVLMFTFLEIQMLVMKIVSFLQYFPPLELTLLVQSSLNSLNFSLILNIDCKFIGFMFAKIIILVMCYFVGTINNAAKHRTWSTKHNAINRHRVENWKIPSENKTIKNKPGILIKCLLTFPYPWFQMD